MPNGSFCDDVQDGAPKKPKTDFAESALNYPEGSGIRVFLLALSKAKPNESVLPSLPPGSSGWGFDGQK